MTPRELLVAEIQDYLNDVGLCERLGARQEDIQASRAHATLMTAVLAVFDAAVEWRSIDDPETGPRRIKTHQALFRLGKAVDAATRKEGSQ